MTRIHLLAAAACAALLAGSAFAAKVDLSPAPRAKVPAIMHERHEGMEKVGKLTKQLARAVKADPIDSRAVRMNAEAMDILAQKSAAWFPAGTGPESGKTDARAEIWQKPQDFSIKMTSVAGRGAQSAQLRRVRPTPAATRAAFAELGKTCKSCHTTYRKDLKASGQRLRCRGETMRILPAVIAALSLAACNQSDGNVSLDQANASGNAASAALENAAAAAPGAPLDKQAALALMKQRHEDYEKIGNSMKAVSRELKGSAPDLAKVRAGSRRHRRGRAENPDLVPGRHRPRRRQDRGQGRNLAETGRLQGQGRRLHQGGAGVPGRGQGQ